jgi:hypothetical protein
MAIGKTSRKQVEQVRHAVYDRDQHRCIIEGTFWQGLEPCRGQLTVQHRVSKGAGGSAKYDAANYLLAMCLHHNQLAEASAEFARFCTRNGISVRRSIADQYPMSRIPVRYQDGWHLLDGAKRFAVPDATAEDLMLDIYGQ